MTEDGRTEEYVNITFIEQRYSSWLDPNVKYLGYLASKKTIFS